MESAEALEPLVELPTDLVDQDLPNKEQQKEEVKKKLQIWFVDYDGLEKGIVAGAYAFPLFFACCSLMI